METDRIEIPQNGFLRVFSSNMEAAPVSINNTTLSTIPGKLVEEYNYYPYGLVFGASSAASTIKKTDYLYTGKELQHNEFGAGNGLELTDYGARLYDAQIGRWTAVDPLAEKYNSLTPYTYCNNNPINAIDFDGRDIIVLRNSDGAHGSGHAAILVGNNKTGWTYISKDGYTGSVYGSPSLYVVKKFNTVKDFRDSEHNYVLRNGVHSTTDGTEAKTFNYALDIEGNKIQRYDKALYIKTTKSDGSSTDEQTIEAATKSAASDFCLWRSDCSDVVTSGLNVSENSNGEQIQNGELNQPKGGIYDEQPNKKFNKIQERNPDAIDCSAGVAPDNY
ncbi:MAG TPA: RHS repeat-associated core domain-containing protein [Bacteroidia bacterium]|nr:RHS repeat-associated core domain-containing protein [Bacteroidia bacterium]